MSQRSPIATLRTTRPTAHPRDRSHRHQVRLVKVRSGVAAGRTTRHPTHTEWWTLFTTRDQFDACVADDPMRFRDPLLFTQIKAQLDDLFDR
jgi:hypothetical protein